MSEDSISNNIKNSNFSLNTDESDYTYLNIKLEEIKNIISLLEKNLFR